MCFAADLPDDVRLPDHLPDHGKVHVCGVSSSSSEASLLLLLGCTWHGLLHHLHPPHLLHAQHILNGQEQTPGHIKPS